MLRKEKPRYSVSWQRLVERIFQRTLFIRVNGIIDTVAMKNNIITTINALIFQ